MSVIAARRYDDKIVVAADSIVVRGWTQKKRRSAKLWQENGVVSASVGYAADSSLLRLFCKRNHPPEATEYGIIEFISDFVTWSKKSISDFKLESNFLLCFERELFHVINWHVEKIDEFAADGAGMEFALAALHLGKTPEEAVAVACELSVYCERPVNVIEVSTQSE